MTAISPELVLVDPDLARTAREALYAPGEFVPGWRELPQPLPRLAARPERSVPEVRPTAVPARRRRAALLAAGAGVALFGLVTGLEHPLRHAAQTHTVQAAALHERALQQARAARQYEWPAVPGARSYLAELRRNGSLVYSAVTKTPRTALPTGLPLEAGTYRWTVTPILRDRESRPVVEESFVVNPS